MILILSFRSLALHLHKRFLIGVQISRSQSCDDDDDHRLRQTD